MNFFATFRSFFFNDTAPPEIYTLSLPDALPILQLSPVLAATGTYPFVRLEEAKRRLAAEGVELIDFGKGDPREETDPLIRRALVESGSMLDRKSTRLNSSHLVISYAVFCLKKNN